MQNERQFLRAEENPAWPRGGLVRFAASAFAGTLAVLLFHKAAQIVNSLGGAESVIRPLNLIGQSVLFLGWDVVGALVWAAVVTMLAWPVGRFINLRIGRILAILLLLAHGLFLGINFFASQATGAPIDKAAMNLGLFFRDPLLAGRAISSRAVWDSISHFFTVTNFLFLGICALIAPLVFLGAEARFFRPGKWARRVTVTALTILTFLTVVILPHFVNGEWMGVRVQTFGLERSPFVHFVWSYGRPLWRRMTSPAVRLDDPYCMDFASIVGPPLLERNPLWRDGLPTDSEGGPSVPRRTNVVLVVLESVGEVSLDDDPDLMPFLRELGTSPGGVRFAAHYSPWPQTMQAVFSLMCSEMPYADYTPISILNPDIPCVSLSEALKSAGYATALFCSQDISYESQIRFFLHRSFDLITDMYSLPGREGAWANSWGIDEAVTIRALGDWMTESKRADPSRPIFAYYNMAAGHHPYVHAEGPLPPRPTLKAERQAYRDCLSYIDGCLRWLSDSLGACGLSEDTLLVIVSDHGEAFAQHGARTHGTKVYDEETRVPLVMAGPQLRGVRGTVDFITEHFDVAPTILGLLGIEPPATMKGRDLTRARDARVAILKARTPEEQLGIRDGRWKAILSEETGFVQLFDLTVDPGERQNVAADHRDLADRLIARARYWQAHSLNLIENYASILKTQGKRCVPRPP